MSQLTSFLLVLSLCAFAPLCFSSKTKGGYLYPQFYDHSCPKAQEIVRSVLAKAVAKEARMAASILRLHFHDCFVQVLLLACYNLSLQCLALINFINSIQSYCNMLITRTIYYYPF